MAIDNYPSWVKPLSAVFISSSSSTSSSLSPFNRRRRLVQVATPNSATFIRFPTTARQSSPFVPIYRPRTSQSSTRLSSPTADTQSLSNQSKSSAHTQTPSLDSNENKRCRSQQRENPILNNPLLNHRKDPPKSPSIKAENESSRTVRINLSSQPFQPLSNNTQLLTLRASTVPPIIHPTETNMNISDRLIVAIDTTPTSEQKQYVDPTKLDYITRWLHEVRAATYYNPAIRYESKSTTRRIIES